MTMLKISDQDKVIDIEGYNRVVGNLFKREDGLYHFRRAPFTAKLSVSEEEQVCWIVDELNRSVMEEKSLSLANNIWKGSVL